MLHDETLAVEMARLLLEEGIYVIGFCFPVVPKGQARIRVQLCARHGTTSSRRSPRLQRWEGSWRSVAARRKAMKPEDKSKVQELVNDAGNLRSRNPEESKFKDWKEKTERKLEDVFGKGSEQVSRLKAVRFFDFSRRPPGNKTRRSARTSARSTSGASRRRAGCSSGSWRAERPAAPAATLPRTARPFALSATILVVLTWRM